MATTSSPRLNSAEISIETWLPSTRSGTHSQDGAGGGVSLQLIWLEEWRFLACKPTAERASMPVRPGSMPADMNNLDEARSQALNAAHEGIAMFDGELRLVVWNDAYAKMCEMPPELLHRGGAARRHSAISRHPR